MSSFLLLLYVHRQDGKSNLEPHESAANWSKREVIMRDPYNIFFHVERPPHGTYTVNGSVTLAFPTKIFKIWACLAV